jgi:hypothetical protein
MNAALCGGDDRAVTATALPYHSSAKDSCNPSCAEPTRHLATRYRCLDHRETGAIESAIFRPHFFTVRNERAERCKRYRQAGLGKALPRRRRGSSSGSRRRAHLAASAGAHCSEMAPAVENRGSPQHFLAGAARRATGTAKRSGRTLTARADICRIGEVPLLHQSA